MARDWYEREQAKARQARRQAQADANKKIRAVKLAKGYSVPFHQWDKLQVQGRAVKSNRENRERWALQDEEKRLAALKAKQV